MGKHGGSDNEGDSAHAPKDVDEDLRALRRVTGQPGATRSACGAGLVVVGLDREDLVQGLVRAVGDV